MNNHTKVTVAAIVAFTMLALSACGSGGEEVKSTDSGGSTQANVDSKTDSIEPSNEDCPLTGTQVSEAAGQNIPLAPGPAVGTLICTFANADGTVPTITVTSKLKERQDEFAMPPAYPTNESVFKPEWGPKAFYTVIDEGNGRSIVNADAGTDGFQIRGIVDDYYSKVDPEAMIIDLGDDLASR